MCWWIFDTITLHVVFVFRFSFIKLQFIYLTSQNEKFIKRDNYASLSFSICFSLFMRSSDIVDALDAIASKIGTIRVSFVISSYFRTNLVKRSHKLVSFY